MWEALNEWYMGLAPWRQRLGWHTGTSLTCEPSYLVIWQYSLIYIHIYVYLHFRIHLFIGKGTWLCFAFYWLIGSLLWKLPKSWDNHMISVSQLGWVVVNHHVSILTWEQIWFERQSHIIHKSLQSNRDFNITSYLDVYLLLIRKQQVFDIWQVRKICDNPQEK